MSAAPTPHRPLRTPGRTALVVVDFQGGPLDRVDPEWDRVAMRDNAVAMVAACRAADVPVVWIQEVHKPHLTDMGRELDGSEGPHCLEGAPYTELAEGLGPVGEEFLVRKRRYSGFFGTPLDLILRSYGVDSLVLIGGFTDICVLYTAVDAHQRDLVVNVVQDCVSGSSRQAHDDALRAIAFLQRDALVSTADVAAWLATRTPEPVPV